MDYELDVDIDGVKNELLAFKPSKIRQNQRGTAWTTEVKEKERKRERKGKDKRDKSESLLLWRHKNNSH